ncbi:L-serine ammonia-lyase [Porticoccus sp. W117]|uniref:L-serine ammonia-lyase n=1 Tax=Porticoccus sp. W117 TaxID=3054777 RepID=UPI002597AE4D|nr:L-serine ammonia-lyase [Porticoccus sp. W117]MDM3872060.1 L-serine ammonia-lyase [Porticoccus sp. W117]
MATSVFDIFKIGIGPSSSHTVGPMRAAATFAACLEESGLLSQVARVKSELYGSLGATGKGHGSHKAVLLGLEGEDPETVDVDSIAERVANIREQQSMKLLDKQAVTFNDETDLLLHRRESLPYHANGMKFTAYGSDQQVLDARVYYSVGGGFVVDENAASEEGRIIEDSTVQPHPFKTGEQLLQMSADSGFSISKLMLENEKVWRSEQQIRTELLNIWRVMDSCIDRGFQTEGMLPGGLKVKRRAPQLYRQLSSSSNDLNNDAMVSMDWVSVYALAVNEENAGGGRVVTAPTNGAAGIIPAVLRYFHHFCDSSKSDDLIVKFLLTAAAIGILYKENASISGAEVGCQGEVGSACSMAAGALTEVLGGTPEQVENAAEIAMEHNLGLTCDPIGGLVQVPCIERNAMAAIKAISASRMALRGDGKHFVSLDKVIKTMRDTGRDMQDKYKETARGGLAVNVIEVPVNIVEC